MEDTEPEPAQDAGPTSWAPQKLPKAELKALAEVVPVGGGVEDVDASVAATPAVAEDSDAPPGDNDDQEPSADEHSAAEPTTGPPLNVMLAYASVGLALAGVFLGFTGLWVLPITACVLAILAGHVSLWLQPRLHGRERLAAWVGLAFGYLILAVWVAVYAVSLIAPAAIA